MAIKDQESDQEIFLSKIPGTPHEKVMCYEKAFGGKRRSWTPSDFDTVF